VEHLERVRDKVEAAHSQVNNVRAFQYSPAGDTVPWIQWSKQENSHSKRSNLMIFRYNKVA